MIYPKKKAYTQLTSGVEDKNQNFNSGVKSAGNAVGSLVGLPVLGDIVSGVDNLATSLTKKEDGTYKSKGAAIADKALNPLSNIKAIGSAIKNKNINDLTEGTVFGFLTNGETTAEKNSRKAKTADIFSDSQDNAQGGRQFYGAMPKFKPNLYAKGGKIGGGEGEGDDGRKKTGRNATESWMYDNGILGDVQPSGEVSNGFFRKALNGYSFAPLGEDKYSYGDIYDYLQDAKNRESFKNQYGRAMEVSGMKSTDDYLQKVFNDGRKQLFEQAASSPDQNILDPSAMEFIQQKTSSTAMNNELNKTAVDKNVEAKNERISKKENSIYAKPGTQAEKILDNETNGPATFRKMKFARGGSVLLGGKRHSDGGNPIYDQGGNIVAETEKGELLFDDKSTKGIENKVKFIQKHGKEETEVKGGERIYSRKDTKKILSLVKKKNFEQLGKHVYKATLTQDKTPPQFKQ